jgi:hypothetical protein
MVIIMIGAFKARFRTLIDQLRFGNLSMDQSMVLQGKAFFFYYEEKDVPTDGKIEIYVETPVDKSIIVNARLLNSETAGVEYRVFGGAAITAGTGTPLIPKYRNSKLAYPCETLVRINPTFASLGTESDYEPHYPDTSGTGKKPTDESFLDGEIKEVGPNKKVRLEYSNSSGGIQSMFLLIKFYEVNTDGVHAGRTDNY